MILFFSKDDTVFAVQTKTELSGERLARLKWLFGNADYLDTLSVEGDFIGPRREMITPWSTNAVEITQNMGLEGIVRIEEFRRTKEENAAFDPMLNRRYHGLGQDVFTVDKRPDDVVYIENIEEYNRQEGLALSAEEMEYLREVSRRMGRPLTDSEVFGFSQVNSEHCRHKIFNGEFVIDGRTKPETLFKLIKKTTSTHPGRVVSAYKDNCAFLQGPVAEQFAPATHDKPDYFETKEFESVISVKAETHNFPTTVEPFNGAATGTGGEIRDRIAGGKGAFPVAGTAVYMTSYPRTEPDRPWEQYTAERPWLYQTPEDILIKASNGASDFGNKFGQPLICGSLLTFEHFENGKKYGYDKVIMQAGGVGYGKKVDSIKDEPRAGDPVVLLGGDNYRIGMGGGAVSSVATGEYQSDIELNAVQRSNPEMQKRAYNAIRAVSEEDINPIVSIHDHGAGGHLNCLSELVEATGGRIDMEQLPVGDPTLSAREIVGNESQERMGLVIDRTKIDHLRRIADRERSPMYVIGEATGDGRFTFVNNETGEKPIDWPLEYMFGKAPRTVMNDRHVEETFGEIEYTPGNVVKYIEELLQLEAVACKDWLTNKVDRSVTGRIAMQQCAGAVQLPLNDCAVVALDYQGTSGIATALGHAPVAALADPGKGSVLAIAEALTNIVFAPLACGLEGVSLSANWMWPCKNEGEDARLYDAVQAASDFAIALGINIPTGKDSLSMTQKYPDGEVVYAPGTVIITSAAEVSDIKKTVSPALKHRPSQLVYVDLSGGGFGLGGSSFGQLRGRVGMDVPTVADADYFAGGFAAVQRLIAAGRVLAGHDVSAGGLVTTLLEMTFADNRSGMSLDLDVLGEKDIVRLLFSEKPAVVLQVEDAVSVCEELKLAGVNAFRIGEVNFERRFRISNAGVEFDLLVDHLRDLWYKSSYLLDRRQSGEKKALERYTNYKNQELVYKFPEGFTGKYARYGIDPHRKAKTGIRAAIIREKGCQCDREMAWCMYLAGMDVKDVHMTDLVSGRETLEDVNMIVFVGGFSNSDVLGSAKGWAGAFLYNEKAKQALDRFYARPDTLSLGVCNGCQLMIELGLITPSDAEKPRMLHNDSHKFESGFVGVEVRPSNSVLLGSLAGSRLGVWIAHGEGKFRLPYAEEHYNVALKYTYEAYPANPNGSDYNVAGIVSADGRHLAMMPHLERSLRPWNWAWYPEERTQDEVSPWIEAFVNARKWIETNAKR
ncbi:phosphoribosylformylglycinamidine synthase [Gallalistipes aquisgranensis]|uniref:phosphoribosylformylglycinamidine synthase n=1 Tax=Gallalistipes aquisgranensis TaxID=2779358 RepID=UPI001CF8EE49|nr:phosphoribosylformylglycinamidine synthase [Gallalistipes aquisgranensis]MBE5033621.1 phosphoribosylformylglycinamidine synthase [Gallalistipes aquisgranensis]